MWGYICQIAHDVYRTLIPYPEHRIPIQYHHVPQLIFPFIPLIYMAYLSRRPDTFFLRLTLLPVVVCAAFGTYFRFVYTEPELSTRNWGQGAGPGLLAELISGKAIDLAWRREGMLKVGETKPGVLRKSKPPHHLSNGNVHNDVSSDCDDISPYTAPPKHGLLPPWLYDALEVIFATRGLGWQFGVGIHVPIERRSLERYAFLRATAISTLKHFVIIDALDSLIKLIPEVGSPQGGTIFRSDLPIPQRYMFSTAIHLATGACLISGFEVVYGLITLFALTALSSTPEMWPPIMDDPWKPDSLHIFWAKRWHQVLRETFFVYGGFFGKWLAGNVGMLFGTFIGSGIYHELAAYNLGKGFDWHVMLFFGLQAPLLLLEKLWYRVTGHRVGGIYGRVWVYFCVIVMGQPLVNSWFSRGLGGGVILPPAISPARQVIIPLLRRVEEVLRFGPLSALQMFVGGRM
ncbi:hypothetical protein PAXRUDRAFT_177083 [Paxillus rubicundulus Ve08.2h10]|uniref:Wax synthase domain-containing protein n=1 Tax=Paxillus rubicundulus Ve08.2h10 TaxID=930991 RepID=A0A0D0D9Y4_9AGAM|nr:hypothetical protein PAXRUDRAFT_177083 [Paxillus rubicundulus Ve08.2h10]